MKISIDIHTFIGERGPTFQATLTDESGPVALRKVLESPKIEEGNERQAMMCICDMITHTLLRKVDKKGEQT